MEVLQILFFAAIAVFLGFRLYTLLGRPQGRSPEEHARDIQKKQAEQAQSRQAQDGPQSQPGSAAPSMSFEDFDEEAQDGLMAIADIDPRFDPLVFLKGARSAYTMIVKAYADGDTETLKPLLSERVASAYEESLSSRQSREEMQVTEIERLKKVRIAQASLSSGKARIKVAFSAEIASEVRDKQGEVISGDINTLKTVDEIWSFERPVDSDNPNWVLASVKPVT